MGSEAPDHLRLVRRAQRDLDRIPPHERTRLVEDLVRPANRTLPAEIKKITALPGQPLQADAGRYRILHLWDGRIVWVLAVFPRAQQRTVFRNLRRTA